MERQGNGAKLGLDQNRLKRAMRDQTQLVLMQMTTTSTLLPAAVEE